MGLTDGLWGQTNENRHFGLHLRIFFKGLVLWITQMKGLDQICS